MEAAGQVDVADPGGKPDDRAGERAARHRAVAELRSALTVEAAVRAAAADAVEGRAEAAVWLGASLADLAAVTGRTRQAARKRWPGLGDVSRRRRFLGYHVDDVLWAARLVLDAADDLEGVDEGARAALADAVAEAERAFRGEPGVRRRRGRPLAGVRPSRRPAPARPPGRRPRRAGRPHRGLRRPRRARRPALLRPRRARGGRDRRLRRFGNRSISVGAACRRRFRRTGGGRARRGRRGHGA